MSARWLEIQQLTADWDSETLSSKQSVCLQELLLDMEEKEMEREQEWYHFLFVRLLKCFKFLFLNMTVTRLQFYPACIQFSELKVKKALQSSIQFSK